MRELAASSATRHAGDSAPSSRAAWLMALRRSPLSERVVWTSFVHTGRCLLPAEMKTHRLLLRLVLLLSALLDDVVLANDDRAVHLIVSFTNVGL